MNDREQDARVAELLGEAYPRGVMRFSAGFADRVMTNARESARTSDVATAMIVQCRRVLPALLAASVALVAWNVTSTRAESDSLLLAVFGVSTNTTSPSSSSMSMLQGAEAFQ